MQLLELHPDLLREVCLGHSAKVAKMSDALADMDINRMGLWLPLQCPRLLFCPFHALRFYKYFPLKVLAWIQSTAAQAPTVDQMNP